MTPPTLLDRDKEAVMEAQSRAAFEKWAEANGFRLERPDYMRGEYLDNSTHAAFKAWQARGSSDYEQGVKDAAKALDDLWTDACLNGKECTFKDALAKVEGLANG